MIVKKFNGLKNPTGVSTTTTASGFDDGFNSNEDNDFDSNSISDSSSTGFPRFGDDVTESSATSTKAPKKSNNKGNDDFGDSLQFSDDVF